MDIREVNNGVVAAFRAGDDPPGMHRDRLLLLTTRGAKTGREHIAPLMFHRDGERLFVIASANAAPRDPQWYRNLRADPDVHVEVGDESFAATAAALSGPARDEVWTSIKRAYPFFAEHEAKIDREIPVVELLANRAG